MHYSVLEPVLSGRMCLYVFVLVSTPPSNPAKSFPTLSSTTSISSPERDELMDVGLEFMTDTDTGSKPSYPPDADTSRTSADASSSSTHQVSMLTGLQWREASADRFTLLLLLD